MFRHFSLWGCLAITLGIWWTCWLMVRGRGQWAEAPREGGRGGDLATSDLNQTNIIRLPRHLAIVKCVDVVLPSRCKGILDISTRLKQKYLLPNWCMRHFSEFLTELSFSIKIRSQWVWCCINPQFTWSGCTCQLSDHLLHLKKAQKASLRSAITAPHVSLIVRSVSHRIHLLVSPSPLSNHPLCSGLSSGALFCSSALLFFSACFSCCLVCLPCFIWFSPAVTCHNTHLRSRTATVWDLLSASHEWFNQIIFTPVCCGVKALYGRLNQL